MQSLLPQIQVSGLGNHQPEIEFTAFLLLKMASIENDFVAFARK